MTKTYFVFRDLMGGGAAALFENEATLKAFLKEYTARFIEDIGETPVKGEDYSIIEGMMNPSHDEWYNED